MIIVLQVFVLILKGGGGNNRTEQLDDLLAEIGDVTSGNLGSLCISQQFRSVPVSVRVDAFEAARQKADMLARLLQDLGQLDNQGLLTFFHIIYSHLYIRSIISDDIFSIIEDRRWLHCLIFLLHIAQTQLAWLLYLPIYFKRLR